MTTPTPTRSRPREMSRGEVRSSALSRLLPGVLLLCCPGCLNWWNRGPIDEPLMESRQLTMQATYASEHGDVARAEKLLNQAVANCAEDCDARCELAELLWREHRGTEALAMFDAAIELAPRNAALLVRRGELQRELGFNPDSRRSAEQALNVAPDYAPAWMLRARTARAFGNSLEAIEYYQRVLGLTPDDANALTELAELQWNLARRGGRDSSMRYQMALASSQRLLATLPPEDVQVKHLLLAGGISRDLRRWEDALQSMQAAAKLAPDSAPVLLQLAECQLLAGEPGSAYRTAMLATSLDPGNRPGQELLQRIRLANTAGPGPAGGVFR